MNKKLKEKLDKFVEAQKTPKAIEDRKIIANAIWSYGTKSNKN